jgi:RNA polymerase sigma-70 factor (ECF subfamily)
MNINLQSFKNGDHDTFRVVFNELYPELKFWLLNKYQDMNVDDAEDCLSEAFVWLYLHRQRIREQIQIKKTLFIICKHRAIDFWRNRLRTTPLVSNIAHADDVEYDEERAMKLVSLQIASDMHYPMEESEIEKARKILPMAIEKLPTVKRQVIKFFLLEYDSWRIADLLGIDRQTVLNHKTKAIENLSKMINYALKTGNMKSHLENPSPSFTHNGVTRNANEWSVLLGGDPSLVCARIKSGWAMEKALSTPARRKIKPHNQVTN